MDRNHQPKARAKPRRIVRRKPECKRCEATDRNRIVKAQGCEASWHMTAKPTGTQPTVNAALVHRQFAHLPGEICAPWRCSTYGRNGRVVQYLMRPGARSRSPISSERIGPDPSDHTARLAVMHRVRPQKSAEAMVVFQCFARVAEHEWPNLRCRAEQWVARGSTINPTGLVECGAGPRCRSCAHSVRSP